MQNIDNQCCSERWTCIQKVHLSNTDRCQVFFRHSAAHIFSPSPPAHHELLDRLDFGQLVQHFYQ
jgi:hypothetical protein